MGVKLEDYFGTEIPKERSRKHLAVIIYDISDNKQRRRMVKYLEGFDHVKIYWLRGSSETFVWGDPPNFEEEDVVII